MMPTIVKMYISRPNGQAITDTAQKNQVVPIDVSVRDIVTISRYLRWKCRASQRSVLIRTKVLIDTNMNNSNRVSLAFHSGQEKLCPSTSMALCAM